jgi:hypothetical protein
LEFSDNANLECPRLSPAAGPESKVKTQIEARSPMADGVSEHFTLSTVGLSGQTLKRELRAVFKAEAGKHQAWKTEGPGARALSEMLG